jgi:DNA-binding NarL/FixJ family response regulator
VLLADRHHGLCDGVRGLLETEFETVFMVADEASLLEGTGRLKPPIVVLDLSFAGGDLRGLLARLPISATQCFGFTPPKAGLFDGDGSCRTAC